MIIIQYNHSERRIHSYQSYPRVEIIPSKEEEEEEEDQRQFRTVSEFPEIHTVINIRRTDTLLVKLGDSHCRETQIEYKGTYFQVLFESRDEVHKVYFNRFKITSNFSFFDYSLNRIDICPDACNYFVQGCLRGQLG